MYNPLNADLALFFEPPGSRLFDIALGLRAVVFFRGIKALDLVFPNFFLLIFDANLTSFFIYNKYFKKIMWLSITLFLQTYFSSTQYQLNAFETKVSIIILYYFLYAGFCITNIKSII